MTRDALVVGINQYCDFDSLDTPAGDAEAIAQLLEQYGEFNVVKRLPECVRDGKLQVAPKEVTAPQLKQALERLFKPEGDNIPDTALFFFAGHGHRVKNQNGQYEGFLATSESHPDPAKGKPGLSLQWLRKLLERSPVREQVVWLDCCYSGELLNFEEVNPAFWKGHDCCFIAASREHEVAYQHPDGKHGLLSGILLEKLNPQFQQDGIVTSLGLTDAVTKSSMGGPQGIIGRHMGGRIILTRNIVRPATVVEPTETVRSEERELVTVTTPQILKFILEREHKQRDGRIPCEKLKTDMAKKFKINHEEVEKLLVGLANQSYLEFHFWDNAPICKVSLTLKGRNLLASM